MANVWIERERVKNKAILLSGIALFIIIIAVVAIISSSHNSVAEEAVSTDTGEVLGASTQNQSSGNDNSTYQTIDVAAAKDLIADNQGNKDFIILDIRTPEEYAAGHLDGSENIDFYNNFEAAISKLDKSKIYLIYCRTGHRSSQALEMFKNQDFAEVNEIAGGYESWQNL